MKSVNPATGEIIQEYKTLSSEEAFEEVKKSRKAFEQWKNEPFNERLKFVKKVGELLRKNSRKYAETMTSEMGKPIKQAIAEAEKCAWVCDYYCENAEKFLKDEPVDTGAKKSYITFHPLGVILGIMPWNFPFWQVIRFAIPAIIAGNTCVLKHASNVPGCALELENLFRESGFPNHVFKTLLVSGKVASEIVEQDLVEGVSLTGSNAAGEKIGEVAGKHVKKLVLELGGSDPFIVLKDADLDFACEFGVSARLQNNGQSCIAAKRFIVHNEVADNFRKKYVALLKAQKIGDPIDELVTLGPLAREDLLIDLENQVKQAIRHGGDLLTGGKKIQTKGYFYEPTLIEVKKDNPILQQELFGPVALLVVCENEEEMLEVANNTEYGLGASVWGRDSEHAEKFAQKVEAGMVFVNSIVKSDPRIPFGGIKKSGIGRELSHYGLKEFVNIKTIVVTK